MRKDILHIIREMTDMTDIQNFRTIMSLNETEQKSSIIILCNKLYKMITNKLDSMDFKDIAYTKGDITKLRAYKQTKECIEVLMGIAEESGNGIEEVRVIDTAFRNVQDLKPTFTQGFKLDIDIIKYFYNTIVMGIITDIGFMTTVCVEFIKNPNSTVTMEINNLNIYNSKFSLVHSNLELFNTAVKKGDITKAFDALSRAKARHESVQLISTNEGIIDTIKGIGTGIVNIGSVLLITVASIIASMVLPILRDLTYTFFYYRAAASDWFKLQKELLDANEARLKAINAGSNDREYKKVIEAQKKWSNRMEYLSNLLAIDYISAEKKAKISILKDSKTNINKQEIEHPDMYSKDNSDGEPSLF